MFIEDHALRTSFISHCRYVKGHACRLLEMAEEEKEIYHVGTQLLTLDHFYQPLFKELLPEAMEKVILRQCNSLHDQYYIDRGISQTLNYHWENAPYVEFPELRRFRHQQLLIEKFLSENKHLRKF